MSHEFWEIATRAALEFMEGLHARVAAARHILHRLPHLLEGRDPEFAAYFQRLAHEVRGVELPR